MFRSSAAVIAAFTAGFLLLLLVASFVAPLPYEPGAQDAASGLTPPNAQHWFGTDVLGRDLLSRVVVATRLDLPLTFAGTAAALALGVPAGLLASRKGRLAGGVMRALDMLQAFPLLVLALAMVAVSGNSIWMVVFAVGLTFAPSFTRLIRSEALAIRESRYMEAAIAIGASPSRITMKHLLPNVAPIIFVQAALTASRSLLLISALSFLGVGVTPPTPSWGAMIQTGSQNIATGQWWISMFPGLCIVVAVLLFNLIGDCLETALGRGARG